MTFHIMNENDQKHRCEAITKAGTRCKRPARPGKRYCYVHRALEEQEPVAVESEEQTVEMPEQVVEAEATVAAPAKSNGQPAPAEVDMREQVRVELQRAADERQPAIEEQDRTLQPVTSSQLMEAVEQILENASPAVREKVLAKVQELVDSGWLDRQTWEGIAMVAQVALEMQIDFLKRRFTGDYYVDKWGYDAEVAEYMALVLGLIFKYYWRVEMEGVENIPNSGRALLVSNHSGVLPLDGAMIAYGVREFHPAHRLVRALVANWFPTLPFFSMILNKTGQVLAHPDNGRRLLAEDELVLVFPEGYKGVGKLFKDRYRLARFGRGGFVRLALEARAPIIPVSVVGAEETYPMLADAKPIARALGFPFFPITPTWPWLGPLGLIPLPTKWYIDIGEPIETAAYDDEMITNPAFVSELSDLVRQRVQEQIDRRLAQRESVFFG